MRSWTRENIEMLTRMEERAALLTRLRRGMAVARMLRKFDSDQPRVPAGSPDGGQWTSEDDSPDPSLGITGELWAQAKRLAAANASMDYCVNQCMHLLERWQPAGSDRNEFAFRKCLNRCLGKNS